MVIKVTKECILAAKRTSHNCPIAKAMKLAGLKNVCVGYDVYWVGNDWSKELPIPAQKFIRAFDSGESVNPFQFTIHAA